MESAGRAQVLGGLIRRVQALASGIARRSRWIGRLALVAAPVAWVTLFGRWAFDSVPQFLFFAVVLAVLMVPGLVLLAFARLLAGTVSTSEAALGDLAGSVAGAGVELGGGVAGVVAKPGLRSLATLLGSLWQLRHFRSEFGSVVGAAVGSTRLFNPLFLFWVGAAALGAGLVVLLAIVGVVVWVV
ncbi:MAG: hypothetical protein HKN74_06120 [Acidimicrobiia bacterium]|nr:hypothetical protein [Acidimicrobiia bacterium]MBT8217488.1 hypothetical protein [Acidimicrobiia bacterium]NNF09843.1 hypothetical protein [Acidimicrobiia bacterium]NNL68568.1 hypothetical protein [Acidimicrobiia bacterium]